MTATRKQVTVEGGDVALPGDLTVPDDPSGFVLFAHGSGSSRRSPRNRAVAASLNEAGFGTLLFDLLTAGEDRADEDHVLHFHAREGRVVQLGFREIRVLERGGAESGPG